MALAIIQWNCRGIRPHQAEFEAHLMGLKQLPHIICLQETHLKADLVLRIPGYQPAIRLDRTVPIGDKAAGGGYTSQKWSQFC